MAYLNWSMQQVEEDLREHHQKVWRPVFRKYERHVIEYAENKKQIQKEPSAL